MTLVAIIGYLPFQHWHNTQRSTKRCVVFVAGALCCLLAVRLILNYIPYYHGSVCFFCLPSMSEGAWQVVFIYSWQQLLLKCISLWRTSEDAPQVKVKARTLHMWLPVPHLWLGFVLFSCVNCYFSRRWKDTRALCLMVAPK